jgi:hypothetical protein
MLLVRPMMHAFGDHPNPAPDTVTVMEEILMDYMVDVVRLCIVLLLLDLYPWVSAVHHSNEKDAAEPGAD